MSDDDRTFDFFGLSDAARIQSEIESELGYRSAPATYMPEDVQNGTHHCCYSASHHEQTSETKPVSTVPWARTAIIVFLICTIGTGTLGFGLGAGFGRVRSVNGTAGYHARSFETVSYVFETVSEYTVVGSLADMVELVVPSIVAITTERDEPPGNLPTVSHGSGVIFAEDAQRIFIATSWSVVRNGSRWLVSINGNPQVEAFPFGSDRDTDLAVAAIYKRDLIWAGIDSVVIASFGDSSDMRIGDVVLAIGNAMGDGISVTRGIISATEDEFVLPGRTGEPPIMVLQTDAAINMGSSGGALINSRGEVIGININHASTIFGSSPVEGMGYSISSNFASPIVNEMVHARRPALGIIVSDVPQELAQERGIPRLGAYVFAVSPNRAAYIAGIAAGDIITSLDGTPIFSRDELVYHIRTFQVGDTVVVNVLRDRAHMTFTVVLMYTVLDNF